MRKDYLILLNENYDYILDEWNKCEKERENYNGWQMNNTDDIKQLIYNSISLKLSYDIFYKFKLDKYLGKKYTDKLFSIFNKRNDYDLFRFIFNETICDNETPSLIKLSEVKENIDSSLEQIEFIENSVYQMFTFSDNIKDVYYQGDLYLGADKLKSKDKADLCLEICTINKKDNFFPKLVDDIQSLIGNDNCIYDYFEMGQNGFCLFWNIAKKEYPDIMNKIKGWVKYNEIENCIYFRIKDVDDPDNVIETVGDKKVRDNY